MIELFTLKSLYDAVNFLFKLSKEFEAADDARRQRVGKWLVELGLLVESVAMDLEHNQFPYASCAKMGYMVDSFMETVSNSIDHQKKQELFAMLENARNLERLFSEFRELDYAEKDDNIVKLKQIAGTLQGAGSVLANS